MDDYNILEYDALPLAERDPFEIGELGILRQFDIGRYYGSIVNSMIHTTLIGQDNYTNSELGVESRYFFGESVLGARLITGNSELSDIMPGSNRVLIEPSRKLIIGSIGDLFDSFDRIKDASELVDGEFGEDWSTDLRTDLIDYQFSDSGNYFRFNFHHPDEQRIVSRRLL